MIAVAASSPSIILARLACFDLFNKLFSRIYISAEVHHEVVIAGSGLPGSSEVERAKWIQVAKLQNQGGLSAAQQRHPLGAGELSTILLAKEAHANTVLLDDYNARKLARADGLDVRGRIGILETLYLRGHLGDLRAAFQQLLSHSYVDRRLLDLRLKSFGISPL